MTTAQVIARQVAALPAAAQQEVLDFVEFLAARSNRHTGSTTAADTAREREWSDFSLAAAMRGMEEEPAPYTLADVKEPCR